MGAEEAQDLTQLTESIAPCLDEYPSLQQTSRLLAAMSLHLYSPARSRKISNLTIQITPFLLYSLGKQMLQLPLQNHNLLWPYREAEIS